MPSAVEHREHSGRHMTDGSDTVFMSHHSPRARRSPRRERFYPVGDGSPRARSPSRNNSNHRVRSPVKERLYERPRSPKQTRQRSPTMTSSSSSPSPRTKRLRRAQAEREADKLVERENGRNSSRGDRDKGRYHERRENKEALIDKRMVEGRNETNSSRSLRRDHSVSLEHNHNRRHSSRSPPRATRRHSAHDEASKSKASEHYCDGDFDSISKMKDAEEALDAKEKDKQKPSFELSGKLAEETNRVRGITLLFTEPPDACKPDIRWRLYVFKAGEVLNEPLYVHRQSCYLFGRERRVADIPTDHPSCSKQHAVLQYRQVEKEQPDGLMSNQIRPYIMDLGSTNGTFINENRIEPQRYYELFEKDTIKFGNSSREYVLLHENSAT